MNLSLLIHLNLKILLFYKKSSIVSDVMIYNPITAPIIKISMIGRGLNPKCVAKGVNGKQRVRVTINMVATSRYVPRLLLKKGFLLLINRTIIDAETTDS